MSETIDRRFTGIADITTMTGHPHPPEDYAHTLTPGDWAKLLFLPADGTLPESMWVRITAIAGQDFTGTLDNAPHNLEGLSFGDEITFSAAHIMRGMRACDAVVSHSNGGR